MQSTPSAPIVVHRKDLWSAENWVLVLMVTWPMSLLLGGHGWWKALGWLATGVSFAALSHSKLPLARSTRRALSWCLSVAIGLAMLELGAAQILTVANLLGTKLMALGLVAVSISSILAFSTAMQDLARVAGSPATSVQQWRSIRAWQLGVFCVGVGIVLALMPDPPGPYVTDSAFALVFILVGQACAFLAFIVFPIRALNQLHLQLRERSYDKDVANPVIDSVAPHD